MTGEENVTVDNRELEVLEFTKEVKEPEKVPEFAKKHPELLSKFKKIFPKQTRAFLESGIDIPESSKDALEYILGNYPNKNRDCCSKSSDGCTPCCRFVDFCCTTCVPENFSNLLPTWWCPPLTEDLRLVYDINCLTCKVEECEVPVTPPPGCPPLPFIKVYQVRIFGCIPYMASVRIQTDKCGGLLPSLSDKKVDICCNGSVCVDSAICIKGTKQEAEDACDDINNKLKNCAEVKVHLFHASAFTPCLLSNNRSMKFKGVFELPTC
ncbi:MAG: hypothetical protein ACLKAK_06320 [Alkaliphilus sp.]